MDNEYEISDMETERGSDEAYFDELEDPIEAYVDGRGDHANEADQVEEAEAEEEIEAEEAEAEEEEAEAEEEEAEAEEEEAEAEEVEAEAEEENWNAAEGEEAEAEEEEAEAEAEEEEEAEGDEVVQQAATPVKPTRHIFFTASEKRRIVLSQLNAILDEAERNRQKEQEEQQELWYTASGRALHRMNRARLCHTGCPPLVCKEAFCSAAETLAQEMADYEVEHGVNSKLQTDLQRYSTLMKEEEDGSPSVLLLEGDDEECKKMGLVVSRMEFENFDALPEDSVNRWYRIEVPVEKLAASEDPEDRTRCSHYIQLLDLKSKRMGWAAVPVGASGVAYVVAVFCNAAMEDPYALVRVPKRLEAAMFD